MRAIEFKNVSFRYEDMPEPVLKNASFSLEYGKLALLYGDSGQGKRRCCPSCRALSPT